MDIETRDIILTRQRTTIVLIRMRGMRRLIYAFVVRYGQNRFSHDVARMCASFQNEGAFDSLVARWYHDLRTHHCNCS